MEGFIVILLMWVIPILMGYRLCKYFRRLPSECEFSMTKESANNLYCTCFIPLAGIVCVSVMLYIFVLNKFQKLNLFD